MEQTQHMPLKRIVAVAFLAFALLASSSSFAKTRDQFVTEVRQVQTDLEKAYTSENAFTPQTMQKVIASVGEAQALMREVMGTPDNQLSPDEREEIYGQIIRGDEKVDYRGSLARVIWGSLPTRGNRFSIFVRSFYEDFIALTKKKGWGGMRVGVDDAAKGQKAGTKVAQAEDQTAERISIRQSRLNQEMLSRNMLVRMFDIYDSANELEQNDRDFDYISKQLETIGGESNANSLELLAAEKTALILYSTIAGLNIPGPANILFVPFDWVGWLHQLATGGPMSETPAFSNLLSGASIFVVFGALAIHKYFTRSDQSIHMLRELIRAVKDVTMGLDEKDPQYDAKRKAAMDEHKKFVDTIRNGASVLGQHRARMMRAGYDPKNPAACENWLQQLL